MSDVDPNPLEGSKYKAVRLLGAGATGEVYEALHEPLQRRVVAKLLRKEIAERPDVVERLRREGAALAKLAHPNVIAVIDAGTTWGERPFIIMEYLEGGVLSDEIAARRAQLVATGALAQDAPMEVPIGEAVGIVVQVLAGLGAAHAIGRIHRDIKPANIFLAAPDAAGTRLVKVLDWGLVKRFSGAPTVGAPAFATAEGTVLGTPRFLAPEQAVGLPDIGPPADIYQTAIMLYLLLCGRTPFEHHKVLFALLQAHAEEAPVPPSKNARQALPPGVDGVVLKALAKRPADRFASASEFAEALRRLVEPRPVRWAKTEEMVIGGGPATPSATSQKAAAAAPPPQPASPSAAARPSHPQPAKPALPIGGGTMALPSAYQVQQPSPAGHAGAPPRQPIGTGTVPLDNPFPFAGLGPPPAPPPPGGPPPRQPIGTGTVPLDNPFPFAGLGPPPAPPPPSAAPSSQSFGALGQAPRASSPLPNPGSAGAPFSPAQAATDATLVGGGAKKSSAKIVFVMLGVIVLLGLAAVALVLSR